jgi:hypothetical protein
MMWVYFTVGALFYLSCMWLLCRFLKVCALDEDSGEDPT